MPFSQGGAKHFNKNIPIRSMYGIFTYIYHIKQPNVGEYTIHGWYGILNNILISSFSLMCHHLKVVRIWTLDHLNRVLQICIASVAPRISHRPSQLYPYSWALLFKELSLSYTMLNIPFSPKTTKTAGLVWDGGGF